MANNEKIHMTNQAIEALTDATFYAVAEKTLRSIEASLRSEEHTSELQSH